MILKCNLKDLRKYARMTQADLSAKTDITISMISEYENNKSTPTIYSLWKIAKALDCKVDDIYSEE